MNYAQNKQTSVGNAVGVEITGGGTGGQPHWGWRGTGGTRGLRGFASSREKFFSFAVNHAGLTLLALFALLASL